MHSVFAVTPGADLTLESLFTIHVWWPSPSSNIIGNVQVDMGDGRSSSSNKLLAIFRWTLGMVVHVGEESIRPNIMAVLHIRPEFTSTLNLDFDDVHLA
jgi:hypothetical protein